MILSCFDWISFGLHEARPTWVNFQPLIENLLNLQETPWEKAKSPAWILPQKMLKVWWEIGENKNGLFCIDLAVFDAFITGFWQLTGWFIGTSVPPSIHMFSSSKLRYVGTSRVWVGSEWGVPARPLIGAEKLLTPCSRLSTVGLQSFLFHLTCDLWEEVS